MNSNELFTLFANSTSVSQKRTGVVLSNGRNFQDNQGFFYPLGNTLFWALRGWKFERERIKQNIRFVSSHKFDFIRILSDVGWPGNDIRSDWTDYEQLLGELIDFTYDECGLRLEITNGGGTGIDYLDTAAKVANVVNQNRLHKIIYLEADNEFNCHDRNKLKETGRFLTNSIPNKNLVAWTDAFRAGDQIQDYPNEGASLVTVHLDRTYGDDGWRAIRQPWDLKGLPWPISHNEPIGPRSSINENVEPIQLSCLRLNGIICGVESFILHNAAGVAGQVNANLNRPANLWEVPGIDLIMRTLRGLDNYLPSQAGDGQHFNETWFDNPLVSDAIWSDGADHGINRGYLIQQGNTFIKILSGVKSYVNLTAKYRCLVEFYDMIHGKVRTVQFNANELVRIENSPTTDSHGYGAYIIKGVFN